MKDDTQTGTAIVPAFVTTERLAMLCGLPCSLTYFAADLARDMLARAHGACEVVPLNDLSAATCQKLAEAEGRVLALGEVPDAAVADLANEGSFPIIIIAQSFADAARDFMAARGAELLDTVRTMARAQVGLDALAEIPRAAVLTPESDQPASALAERIAAALRVDAGIVSSILQERNLDRPLWEVLDETFAHEKLLPSGEVDEILLQLDDFYGLQPDGGRTKLEVPMAALLEAEAPHLPATNRIELVGPARCLTFGPYFYLPCGHWRARFTFHSTDNASINRIAFDIATDQEIKVDRMFDVDASGIFAFECEFEVHDPYSPLEFRTFLRQGSIEGTFTPLSLTLERCDSGEETTRLASALE